MGARLTVRTASPFDAELAASIYVASSNVAFAAYQEPMQLTSHRIERWEADLARPGHHWWLAELGSVPIGLAGIRPSRDPVLEGVGELDTIAVLPSHWRQGIGRCLMSQANEALDLEEYERAVLWTWAGYPTAAAFYPTVDWELTGVTRDEGRQVCYGRQGRGLSR